MNFLSARVAVGKILLSASGGAVRDSLASDVGFSDGLCLIGRRSSAKESEDALLGVARDLYGATAALELDLVAPLAQLNLAWTGSVAGKLTLKKLNRAFDVLLEVRGETSAEATVSNGGCPFHKLKVSFSADKALRAGTPLQGHGTLRLNNLCTRLNDETTFHGGLGRATGQIGPIREEASYRLVRAFGAPTYGTRLVHVNYTDTSPAGLATPAEDRAPEGANFSRYALLVESAPDALQRLIAAETVDGESAGGTNLSSRENRDAGVDFGRISKENIFSLLLGEALVGNADWKMSFQNGLPQHNISVFGAPIGRGVKPQVAFVEDLDLACSVGMFPGQTCRAFTPLAGALDNTALPFLDGILARETVVRAALATAVRDGATASPKYYAVDAVGRPKDAKMLLMQVYVDGLFAWVKAQAATLRAQP